MDNTLPTRLAIIPTSHLDLFWLGDYRQCLSRGDDVIRAYLDRAVESGEETFVIDTAVFAEHFLATHPDYEPVVRRLLTEGRLEIGAAYIDRWENLVLPETLIRNVQIGRRWCRDRLGIDARTAAHPDLPGLNAQTAQIYGQAGIQTYVTSRKIFHEGRMWHHIAPDGTTMLMLTWPEHYVFVPLARSDVPEGTRRWGDDWALRTPDLAERFPAGTVPVSGSAGDLASPAEFVARYGKDLREYVREYREARPGMTVEYSIPARVARPYVDAGADAAWELPAVSGTIPSVWGVAPDEEAMFFPRARELERHLLAAEVASVLARLRGRDDVPASARRWQGAAGEDAFFASSDHPPVGRELEWLWRMHAFTQDHNGGGQDGTLSSFQKRVRQERGLRYCTQVVEHALAQGPDDASGAGTPAAVGILDVRLGARPATVLVDPGLAAPLRGIPEWDGRLQDVEGPDGTSAVALWPAPSAGVVAEPLSPATASVPRATVQVSDVAVVVETAGGVVRVGLDDGEVSLRSDGGDGTFRTVLGTLRAVRELGNDVTMSIDEDSTTTAGLSSVLVLGSGPLCTQIQVERTLLDVTWSTVLTVWHHEPQLDVDVHVAWPGTERWQVRLPIGPSAAVPESVTYGTPFHASRWDDVPAGVGVYSSDEIGMDTYARYREVQHWLHVRDGAEGVAILTEHPGFRLDQEDGLEAVLLRTAPSCGDPRLFWHNAGRLDWHFELRPTGPDPAEAGVAELADAAWRRPLVRSGVDPRRHVLLQADGDRVLLSALVPGADGSVLARLVNESARPATLTLSGDVVAGVAELVDLDGNRCGQFPVHDGVVQLTLPPWRIQTVQFRP